MWVGLQTWDDENKSTDFDDSAAFGGRKSDGSRNDDISSLERMSSTANTAHAGYKMVVVVG